MAARNVYELLVEIIEAGEPEERPGDLLNLRHMLQQVLKYGAGMPSRLRPMIMDKAVAELGDDAIRALQTDLRDLLRYVVQGGGRTVPIMLRLAPQADGTVYVLGATRDVVIWVVITLLARAGGAPIGGCPECRRVFYRVRRQKYCSRRCVNRVNMRTHREKQQQKSRTRPAATRRRSGGR